MGEFASKGVAGAGLGLGIAGTALGVLNGGWGNLLGGYGRNYGGCGYGGYGYTGYTEPIVHDKCKTIWEWETRLAMDKVLELKYKLSQYRSMR